MNLGNEGSSFGVFLSNLNQHFLDVQPRSDHFAIYEDNILLFKALLFPF